ncbi:hypothetical protein [uncultured Brachyspira sp.]|jgi:hypothetical protein|uniref:hypothetical protein n=1 Tax=uncultured Brachyspira sp. TaxID=221953 RepID=UPI00258B950B|nr:hypothetical protein [uncultured Brachyspira sp.]
MLYIISIIFGLFIFISIFFLPINALIYFVVILFALNIIFTKSIFKTLKKLFYLFPYFLAIFIIQSLNARGEYYKIFGFYIDKTGADFTIIYFIRIAAILYFISIFFIIIKKLKIPKGAFFDELIRINIFMNIVKKSFFFEFNKIKDKDKTFREKLNLINKLIENVYKDSFKFYPYNTLISRYRKYF